MDEDRSSFDGCKWSIDDDRSQKNNGWARVKMIGFPWAGSLVDSYDSNIESNKSKPSSWTNKIGSITTKLDGFFHSIFFS